MVNKQTIFEGLVCICSLSHDVTWYNTKYIEKHIKLTSTHLFNCLQ